MSFGEHRREYFRLMDELVSGKLTPASFAVSYKSLWMSDCNAEHAQIESWDEAYDAQLRERFDSGEIGIDELGARMRALFGITDSEARTRDFINRVLTACDLYKAGNYADEEASEFYGMPEAREDYHLNDEALVGEVTATLTEYKSRHAHIHAA
jgi:hypothetical protein